MAPTLHNNPKGAFVTDQDVDDEIMQRAKNFIAMSGDNINPQLLALAAVSIQIESLTKLIVALANREIGE